MDRHRIDLNRTLSRRIDVSSMSICESYYYRLSIYRGKYNTILHTTKQLQWHNSNSRRAPLTGELWVSLVSYLEKNDREISGVHCIGSSNLLAGNPEVSLSSWLLRQDIVVALLVWMALGSLWALGLLCFEWRRQNRDEDAGACSMYDHNLMMGTVGVMRPHSCGPSPHYGQAYGGETHCARGRQGIAPMADYTDDASVCDVGFQWVRGGPEVPENQEEGPGGVVSAAEDPSPGDSTASTRALLEATPEDAQKDDVLIGI